MPERRGLLLAILVFTMTASSYQIFAISVLAVDIIDDLGMSRTALGLLGSLNTLVGALTAPTMGRVTDRIGARQAIVVVLVVSGVGMALMALSGNWLLLALSALISGIPQGLGQSGHQRPHRRASRPRRSGWGHRDQTVRRAARHLSFRPDPPRSRAADRVARGALGL